MTVEPLSSASASDPFKSQIIRLLNIPVHLTGSGDVPLPLAYRKYMAYLDVCSTLDDMVAKGLWTIKRPTRTDLIEVFVSKSFFHSHYRKHFSKVADYPEMKAWLEGDPGSVDVDVWGVKKTNYSFLDLKEWLANGGKLELDDEEFEKLKVLKRGKEKRKEKDLEKGKGKEKEKEKKREHKKKDSSKRAK
jgi:hypothetical protein